MGGWVPITKVTGLIFFEMPPFMGKVFVNFMQFVITDYIVIFGFSLYGRPWPRLLDFIFTVCISLSISCTCLPARHIRIFTGASHSSNECLLNLLSQYMSVIWNPLVSYTLITSFNDSMMLVAVLDVKYIAVRKAPFRILYLRKLCHLYKKKSRIATVHDDVWK